MRLVVLLPTGILLDQEATKVVAEAQNGWFALLPLHVDLATALVPGILLFTDLEGREQLVAVDEGLLVKCGRDVRVSVRNGVRGDTLEDLRETVAQRFRVLDEEQRVARSALGRLEAGALRRLLELEERTHGR